VTDRGERRKNQALRRRIDTLIGRVHEARAEIVERGLDAVHEEPDDGDAERTARKPSDIDPADAPA
jgi:hypothetical protein